MGGDHVTVEAKVNAGAHVIVTSPSANRVYRSLSDAAVQRVSLSLGSGASMEWFPDSTIPYAGSRFAQTIEVELAAGATILLWDAVAAGRVARDERWAFASLENEIRIHTAVGRSVIERFQVTPDSVGAFARNWDYVASFFVVGDAIESARGALLREDLAALLEADGSDLLGGVGELSVPGLVVKLVARSAPVLAHAQETLWDRVRRELLGLPVPALRRY